MTNEAHASADAQARAFRSRVERAYRNGKIARLRVERLGCISRYQRKFYLRELKDVIATGLRNGLREEDILTFRRFVRGWIKKGAPIDPKALWIPSPSLQIVIRQVATAFPTLGIYHGDAKLWLSDPLIRSGGAPITGPIKNPRNFQESFIPFNLTLWAPNGSYYESFNKIGFTREWVNDPGEAAA